MQVNTLAPLGGGATTPPPLRTPEFHNGLVSFAVDDPASLPGVSDAVPGWTVTNVKAGSFADAVQTVTANAKEAKQVHVLVQSDGAFWSVPLVKPVGWHWPGDPIGEPRPFTMPEHMIGVDQKFDPRVQAVISESGSLIDLRSAGRVPLEPTAPAPLAHGPLAAMTIKSAQGGDVAFGIGAGTFGHASRFRLLGSTLEQAIAAAQAITARPNNYALPTLGVLQAADGSFYATGFRDADGFDRRVDVERPLPAFSGKPAPVEAVLVTRSSSALKAIVTPRDAYMFGTSDTVTVHPLND